MKSPRLASHLTDLDGKIIRVIVDECVGPDSPLILRWRQTLAPGAIPEFVHLAQSHRGIPDHQILDQLLGKHDVLLTVDQGLHNQARRLGFRSYTLNDHGDMSGKTMPDVPTRTPLPISRGKKDEELKGDYAHAANPIASSLKGGMEERDFQRCRTRRRRIRSYFGDESGIAQASLTIGSLISKQRLLCGYYLALAGYATGLKGLRASEGYSVSGVEDAHPAWCLIHAIRELYLLQLEKKKIEIYVIPPDSLALGAQVLFGSGDASLEPPLNALRTLLKGLESVRLFPCAKGPFHDAMGQKLKRLSQIRANELVPVDFPLMCRQIVSGKSTKESRPARQGDGLSRDEWRPF